MLTRFAPPNHTRDKVFFYIRSLFLFWAPAEGGVIVIVIVAVIVVVIVMIMVMVMVIEIAIAIAID